MSIRNLAGGFVLSTAVALGAASAYAAGALPAGYTEIEYIQGNGSNARIVTDYVPTPNNDKIEAVVSFPTLDKTMTIWCARGSSTSTATWTMFMLNDGGYKLRFDYGSNTTKYFSPTLSADTKYTVTAEGNVGTWTGGTGATHNKVADFTAGGPVTLFASYVNGTGNSVDNWGKHRLYSFKVWRSDELIHYFVPCMDSLGNPTMVDICDNPATLTRSGTFTAGDPGHYYDDSLFSPWLVLPIPDQVCLPSVTPEPGCTLTNVESGANWTFAEGGTAPAGCPFEASYSRAGGVGTVTMTGKAGEECEGVTISRSYVVTDELLVNGGFESGALAPGWTGNGAVGNSGSAYQPNQGGTFISGTYCAIMQYSKSVTQVFSNEVPWCAELTWKCKQRGGYSGVPYAVLVDGEQVFYDPLSTATSEVHYQTLGDIVLLPGEHTLSFQTKSTIDRTLFLDDVSFHIMSTNSLTILPIPNQSCAEGPIRPEFVVSNRVDGQAWTVGGDIVSPLFDVVYSNNSYVGTATVTVSGKGAYAGLMASSTFGISEDDVVLTSDTSVRRISVGDDLVYVFTNALAQTTLTIKRGFFLTDALMVGGGGSGGRAMAGGGGAGGFLELNDLYIDYAPNAAIQFTVGAGGVSDPGNGLRRGLNGEATKLTVDDKVYTVKGGGGGAGYDNGYRTGGSGGSGGGGTCSGTGGAGTEGQGYAGGNGGSEGRAGGGGGAGEAGHVFTSDPVRSGDGGAGRASSITGETVYYAGGGGGGGSSGGYGAALSGSGGLGGGGDGSRTSAGQNGADGFGGGGGGGAWTGAGLNGGRGGTGTVILRFKKTDFDIEPIPCQALAPGGARPDPVVRLIGSSTVLTKDVDYTVSYTDNDALGSALMTVTGIGSYAGKAGYAGFIVVDRFYVKPSVAVEGDGSSWATAMSVTNFFATYGAISTLCEVWIASGTVPATAITVTNNASLLEIRGGFAGTETTIAERPAGARTTFDGEHAVDCLLQIVSTNASAVLELDRLHFCNARANGVIKTGAGSLRVVDCLIAANGLDSNVYGRGMNVQGGGERSLVVRNCTFAGNVRSGNCGGFGLYLNSMGSALVEDSIFVTNGVPSLAAPRAAGTSFGDYARGSAIYSDGVPVTVRGCRFAGNRGPIRYSTSNGAWGGGVVMLNGACGGSLIENCVFIGNTDYWTSDVNEISTTGALVIYLANTTDKVKVNNCTFAYNLTQATYQSAGGITAVKGDVEVVNTILWKNKYSYTGYPGYGSDIQIKKDATMSIRNSIVTTLDGTGIVSATPANLTIDADSVFAADPKLVTTTADYDALVDTSGTRHYYKTTSADAMAAMDAHLLSPAGYVVNGGAAGPATADYSPAIDFGDPAADYSNEPLPNGSRLNVGAFGNTAEASLTAEGQPNAAVDIFFQDGMTRPLVQVTMGLESGAAYHGTVHLVCSTGGVVLATKDWDGVDPGDVLTFLLPYYLPNGTELRAVATVVAPGATTISPSATEEANGSYPEFYGKGGGPNVIHVRPGADCLMDGTSWTDAFPNIPDAMKAAAADPSKTEMWIAGPIVASTQPASVTLSAASFRIRGGFTGVENDESERVAGAVTTLDGANAYRAFYFANSNPVFFERLLFTHGSKKSDGGQVYKSGAGDVTFTDCIFKDNLWTGFPLSGLACYFTGSSSATVSITNCLFDSNRVSDLGSNGSGHGRVIYAQSLRRLAIDGCTFVSNGCDLAAGVGFNSAGRDRCNGSVICASGAPVTVRNCEFRANRGVIRTDTGGIIRLGGASYPSAFTNCLFIGNADTYGESLTDGNNKYPYGGTLLVCYDNADGVCDLDQCTFAYNISDAKKCCAGIQVVKGHLHAHNTIIYGNKAGPDSEAPGDMLLWNDGTATLDYVRLTGDGTYGETASSVISTNAHTRYTMNNVTFGDPSFATTYDSFTNNIVTAATSTYRYHYFKNNAAGTAALLAFDAHLRSKVGMYNNAGEFVKIRGEMSDAIDAGEPHSPYENEPEPNGRRANLGAYGNTRWASRSLSPRFSLILR